MSRYFYHPLLVKQASSAWTVPAAVLMSSWPAAYSLSLGAGQRLGQAAYSRLLYSSMEQPLSDNYLDAVVASKAMNLDRKQLGQLQAEILTDYLQKNMDKLIKEEMKKRKQQSRASKASDVKDED